ncbi:MAG: hypothetical protein LBQ32_12345 [Burkholderiaceae bacterium]|jgi:hypothetical protein|nr:hypothetical protein [Burkholderiaceae bacterium]
MTPQPTAAPDATNPASVRDVLLTFGPPLAVLGLLRFWLDTLAEHWPAAQPFTAVTVLGNGQLAPDDSIGVLMWQASWPVLLTLALIGMAVALLVVTVRAWGWPKVRPWTMALWLVGWSLAASALVLHHLNRAALQTLPEVTATVVEARPQPTTERTPGGALTVLTLPDAPHTPRRVLLEGADPRALRPGMPLRLQRAHGRFWGEYVTRSNAPPAPRVDAPDDAPAAP